MKRRLLKIEIGWLDIELLVETRDAWIGLYYDSDCYTRKAFVCIVPMLPIVFTWPIWRG